MEKLQIVTDSGADLKQDEIEEYGIKVAPLKIQFPEGEIRSDTMTHDTFYDRLRLLFPWIPKTSMPSPGEFSLMYDEIDLLGKDTLSIHISSGLSGTIESAGLGAKMSGKNVTLVDTMTLSAAQRFQVLAASMAANAGWSKEAIVQRLAEVRASTELVFTLETLDYLKEGGRIGRVSSLLGSVLDLKPIIHVAKEDGKYSTVSKVRSMKKAVLALEDHLVNLYGESTPLWVSIGHGQFAEYADFITERLKNSLHIVNLDAYRVSPVLGVHTGPGILGIGVVPAAMMTGF